LQKKVLEKSYSNGARALRRIRHPSAGLHACIGHPRTSASRQFLLFLLPFVFQKLPTSGHLSQGLLQLTLEFSRVSVGFVSLIRFGGDSNF